MERSKFFLDARSKMLELALGALQKLKVAVRHLSRASAELISKIIKED
ncbi:hypothetical protein X728_29845 [Mesorhizobium sp. L103C120A0]|nr:hypothetical protein X728_29845 [Mesorhizobium sp. L103C120A0]